MSPLKWDVSQPPKMLLAREILHNSRQYQISRYQIVHYFKTLKSESLYCFVVIISRLPLFLFLWTAIFTSLFSSFLTVTIFSHRTASLVLDYDNYDHIEGGSGAKVKPFVTCSSGAGLRPFITGSGAEF